MDALAFLALVGTYLPPGRDDVADELDFFRPPWVKKDRFRDWTREQWEQGVKLRAWIENNRIPGEYWDLFAAEAMALERIWDALDWAALRADSRKRCRWYLDDLKGKIGRGNYAHGWRGMPSTVP